MNRAVFLDRDGVINRTIIKDNRPIAPTNARDLQIIEGVSEAITLLRSKNFFVFVVTNQPDIARGNVDIRNVIEINNLLMRDLDIHKIYMCSHDDKDDCNCRKPKDGLFKLASNEYNIELKQSYMVGDRWRDIAAGQSAGCQCLFIDYSYDEKRPELPYTLVDSLIDAAYKIIGV